MLTLKVKKSDASEYGFEIKEWSRTSTGVFSVVKYDDTNVSIELGENDVAYITDQSEFGNTVAVYG